MDDIRTLLRRAPRFRTARVTVTHRADRAAYNRVLERFTANPAILEWVERNRSHPVPPGDQESVWRLWLERPFRFRVEEQRGDLATNIHGGTYELTWQHISSEGRVWIDSRGSGAGVMRLTSGGGEKPSREEFLDRERDSPLFHVWLHPMVAELLDVGSTLLRTYPDRPEATPVTEVLDRREFLDRPVSRVRVEFRDWETRNPLASENFWAADGYELLIDDQTGVVLRLACRADGTEFSVREMSDVAFDEPIDPVLFEPPAGVRQKPYGSPIGRLQRRLRRRRPPRRFRRA